MTVNRSTPLLLAGLVAALSGCSKPATTTTTTATTRETTPTTPPVTAASAPGTTAPPLAPVGAAAVPDTAAAPPANGYSCSFPGPGGRSILARFTLDATGAHDDQGLPFTVLTNSPTALVLAHARDDLATAPSGDVGAYVVAIDRRSLGMVQSTVGLNGAGATRRGHCIAG